MKRSKATYIYWQKWFERLDPDQEIEDEIADIRKKHKGCDCLSYTKEIGLPTS